MKNVITLENCRSYASEANLMTGIRKYGLDNFRDHTGQAPMRYIVARTPEGRWTAVFLVSEFFRNNNTGGYIGVASQYGFMSV